MFKIDLLCDPDPSLVGICPRTTRDTCPVMFIASLFTIVRRGKNLIFHN